jgi:hypothetical protein
LNERHTMQRLAIRSAEAGNHGRRGERAQVRVAALAVLFLVLGFAAGAFWFCHLSRARNSGAATGSAGGLQPADLSEATKSVLRRLDGPVEIRYYSLLDPAGAPDSLKAFSGRVDQLLTEYQQAAGSQLNVARHISQSDDSAAAFADGLKSFNLDKGNACFLGIVVASETQKELLPQLSPDWEQAVEPDLTRAIARLFDASRPGSAVTAPPANAKIIDEVKLAIPDYASISLEDGTRKLQTAALGEFTAAANEMAGQVTDAQQRLSRAQNGGSEAEQQAAMKNLQVIQAAQATKLQKIAAQSQALIQAFTQLKNSTK